MIARTPARRRAATVLALAALALGAAGCGGGSDAGPKASTKPTPSPSVDLGLVDGAKLSATGTTLAFGDDATVAFVPNDQKATGLRLTVLSVARGSIRDLAAYTLTGDTRTSTPYYARVRVRNVGGTDVGNARIPLYGLSSADVLIGASGFTNSFARCPSGPLPKPFASKQTVSACLMFLVPKGATLAGISYRPVASDDPIVWKGKIAAPGAKPTASASPSASPSQ